MSARRELRLAVLLTLIGSLLVLFAARRAWVSLPASGSLTIRRVVVDVAGARVSGLPQALGYVGLAGVVALAATKRWGRVLVGALVAAAGALVVADAVHSLQTGLLGRLAGNRSRDLCGSEPLASCSGKVESFLGVAEHPGWVWVTVVGGLLMLASGALVAVRGRRWAALSSSYDAPAARPAEPVATDKGTWDALDRGLDPTEP